MNAGTEKWRAMSISFGSRSFAEKEIWAPRPHVAEWIRINQEYVAAGAAKDRVRELCMAGLMDGQPCRYPARQGRTSCGRKHE